MTIGIGGAGSKIAAKLDSNATLINVSETELNKVQGGSKRIVAQVRAEHGQFRGSRKNREIGHDAYLAMRREIQEIMRGEKIFCSTGGGTGNGITSGILEDIAKMQEVPISDKTFFGIVLPYAKLETSEFVNNTIEFLTGPLNDAIVSGNTGNIVLFSNKRKFEEEIAEDKYNQMIVDSLKTFLSVPEKNDRFRLLDGHIDHEDFALFISKSFFNHFTYFEYDPSKDFGKQLDDNLNDLVPADPNKPYDMHEIINTIVDNGDFMEVHKDYAKNVICGFARFNGRSTGIIANQPSWLAGVLDCDASRKAARFVRFCDAFNIQILTLVDVPGFLCGTGQEYAGIIDHGAKLMFAYGEATVPKVTITVRKSYGGSHIVMSCKQLRGDMCYAWPNAEIAVMGASGAVGVLQAKAIKAIEDPEERKAFIAEKEAEYKDLFASPYQAANRGYIDDVIEPRYTRSRIIRAFEMLQTKRLTNPLKKHSNIPL